MYVCVHPCICVCMCVCVGENNTRKTYFWKKIISKPQIDLTDLKEQLKVLLGIRLEPLERHLGWLEKKGGGSGNLLISPSVIASSLLPSAGQTVVIPGSYKFHRDPRFFVYKGNGIPSLSRREMTLMLRNTGGERRCGKPSARRDWISQQRE